MTPDVPRSGTDDLRGQDGPQIDYDAPGAPSLSQMRNIVMNNRRLMGLPPCASCGGPHNDCQPDDLMLARNRVRAFVDAYWVDMQWGSGAPAIRFNDKNGVSHELLADDLKMLLEAVARSAS